MGTPRSSTPHTEPPDPHRSDSLDLFTMAMIVVALAATIWLLVWHFR